MANGDAPVPCPNDPPKQYFKPAIGIIYLVGAFATFALVLAGKTDAAWKDVALMIVGALITKSGTIVDYAFGGSQSSDRKTELLAAK